MSCFKVLFILSLIVVILVEKALCFCLLSINGLHYTFGYHIGYRVPLGSCFLGNFWLEKWCMYVYLLVVQGNQGLHAGIFCLSAHLSHPARAFQRLVRLLIDGQLQAFQGVWVGPGWWWAFFFVCHGGVWSVSLE